MKPILLDQLMCISWKLSKYCKTEYKLYIEITNDIEENQHKIQKHKFNDILSETYWFHIIRCKKSWGFQNFGVIDRFQHL